MSIRLLTLSLLIALMQTIEFKFDYAVGKNSTASIEGRILVKANSSDPWTKVCGDIMLESDNIETICRYFSYDNYTQQTEDQDYKWSVMVSKWGYKTIDCYKKNKRSQCKVTNIGTEGCTRDLLIKCGDKWEIVGPSGTTLILPIALIVCSFFVLFLMIIKDYFERRERIKMFIQRTASKEKWAVDKVTTVLASPALFRKNDVAPHHESHLHDSHHHDHNNNSMHTQGAEVDECEKPTVRITSADSQTSSRYVV